jgi:hypothetical protein
MQRQNAAEARSLHAVLALVGIAVVWARLRLLNTPLERDEGEFAYTAWLFLKGYAPYQGAYTMKLPGVGLAYAASMRCFGRDAAGIRLGLLLTDLGCAGLLWALGRRLLGPAAASAAAAAFAVLSLSQGVLGAFAHATHFVVLFALAGALALHSHLQRPRWSLLALGGACFGTAILMKQHAAVLAAAALLPLLGSRGAPPARRLAEAACFLLGAAAPLAAVAAWILRAGTGAQAWFWTVRYASAYATALSPLQGLGNLVAHVGHLVRLQAGLWLAGAVGALLLARAAPSPARSAVFGALAASFLSICPGLYFRDHYFVLLLPAWSLLAGHAISQAGQGLPRAVPLGLRHAAPALLLAALAGAGLHAERATLYLDPPPQVSRDCYGLNPFPESPVIGAYLQAHSGPEDRIGVLGSEPQICFYADRLSATRHIYMYGLTEDQPYAQAMQQEMIRDLEAAQPLFLVYVNVPESWMATPRSPTDLAQWASAVKGRRYRLVGLLNIRPGGTQVFWDQAAAGQAPGPVSVTVWRRIQGPRI